MAGFGVEDLAKGVSRWAEGRNSEFADAVLSDSGRRTITAAAVRLVLAELKI
jgi:hypothetical protein